MPVPLFVGIDAGGTKSAVRACLADTAGEARVRVGPGAQVSRDGPGPAADALAALVADTRAAFGDAPLGGLAIGLAGAGSPAVQAAVADALRRHLGDAPLTVTHDADVALEAAWGSASGAVLVVGTGSIAHARRLDGGRARVGGWGPALGDDGSGTSLGRLALRALLAAWDGGPPTALVDHAEAFGLTDAAAVIAAAHAPDASLAAFAPLLLAAAGADDWVASSALARETNALAQQVGWLATAAGSDVAPRLALAGGLAGEPVYAAALCAALERHLPGWQIARTPVDPSEGALALAMKLAEHASA